MYEYIKGTLVEATALDAIIDVQGIGYHVFIPVSDFGELSQIGEKVLLYTSFVVREMSQTLYGFLTKESRDLFEKLITISGIGPKTGLGIIGHLSFEEMQEAVRTHDCATFVRVPGIGKKTAERLLIELEGRFKVQVVPQAAQPTGRLSDALQALMQLGLTSKAASTAVKKAADALSPECDLSTLITAALKYR